MCTQLLCLMNQMLFTILDDGHTFGLADAFPGSGLIQDEQNEQNLPVWMSDTES